MECVQDLRAMNIFGLLENDPINIKIVVVREFIENFLIAYVWYVPYNTYAKRKFTVKSTSLYENN